MEIAVLSDLILLLQHLKWQPEGVKTIHHPLSVLCFCAQWQKTHTNLDRKPNPSFALSTCISARLPTFSPSPWLLCVHSAGWAEAFRFLRWMFLACIAACGLGLPRGNPTLIYVMRSTSCVSWFLSMVHIWGIALMPCGDFQRNVRCCQSMVLDCCVNNFQYKQRGLQSRR